MKAHNPPRKTGVIKENNIIAFWTVFGFFVGLMVGFFRWIDPFDILSTVAVATLFFYLLAHVSVAFYVRYMEFGKIRFEREEFEKKLDFYYQQLLQREEEIDADRRFIDRIVKEAAQEHEKEAKERAA